MAQNLSLFVFGRQHGLPPSSLVFAVGIPRFFSRTDICGRLSNRINFYRNWQDQLPGGVVPTLPLQQVTVSREKRPIFQIQFVLIPALLAQVR
jgi:hypothetical protein